jgi:peptide-methionine (S)-S-oxide reductase
MKFGGLLGLVLLLVSCTPNTLEPNPRAVDEENPVTEQTAIATFGGGCFWCIEACYIELEGVHSAVSGYMGGDDTDPTYKEVCDGTTGHAEVVQVTYDPSVISYDKLLEVFFTIHDPTQLNRQGNDVGTQYRSAIFWHTEAQRDAANSVIAELGKSGAYSEPIVTEVTEAPKFYTAEDYHQNYLAENPENGYCQVVVIPKVEKFRKVFAERLK